MTRGADADQRDDEGRDDAGVVPVWRRRPSPKVLGLVAVVVLVVAVLGATLGGGSSDGGHTATSRFATDAVAPSTTIPSGAVASGAGGTTGGSEGRAAEDPGRPLPEGPTGRSTPDAAPSAGALTPQDSAKVIKTGSLDLRVKKGAFDSTLSAITAKVTGLRGYVADSTTSSADRSRSGTITVRVPADSFDQLLGDLRRLGEVRGQTEKGTEVTAQYTDLQARLAAQVATRERLNAVLAKASTVPDILSVQDRITEVQTQIEQLQGQLRVLDDQTAMGTLAVSVSEPGAKPVVVPRPDDRTIGSSFAEAWHRFGDGVEALIAWSGGAAVVLLVLLLVAGVAWLGWRFSLRTGRSRRGGGRG